MIKFKLILFIIILFIVPLINASICDINKYQNNITISDSIDPDGKGSDCRATLSRDGLFLDIKNMTRQESFYNVSFMNLGFEGEYNAFIECNNTDEVYFSECNFVLEENRLTPMSCPDNNLGEVIMFIFIFVLLGAMYYISRKIIKIPIVDVLIAIGYLLFSISLMGCNQFIGAVGIMMSIGLGIFAFMK